MKFLAVVLLLVFAFWMLGPAVWMLKFVITRFLAAAGLLAIAWVVYNVTESKG